MSIHEPCDEQLNEVIPDDDFAGEQFAPHIAFSDHDTGLLLQALWNRQNEFQRRVFPNQTVEAKLKHLKREVDEAMANPSDRLEWADCLLLLFAAAAKQGLTLDDLLIAAHQKIDINNDRQWHAPDRDGVCAHVKEGQ